MPWLVKDFHCPARAYDLPLPVLGGIAAFIVTVSNNGYLPLAEVNERVIGDVVTRSENRDREDVVEDPIAGLSAMI